MKILILSCSTGEGHNSAAYALADKLRSAHGAECTVIDPISFKNDKTRDLVSAAYNKLISSAPGVFGVIYKLGAFYEWLRLPSPVYYANSRYAEALYKYISDENFDRIVCTHLFAMQAMTAVRKKFGLSLPCYGVLTDYTTIPFYSDTDLDGYFVANGEVAEMLHKKGILRERIYPSGIPVNDRFRTVMTKTEAKSALQISQDSRVIALMSGGAGCGKIAKLCNALIKSTDEKTVIYVFPGKNEKLKGQLLKAFCGQDRVKIVEFTHEIQTYIKAADAVLSKPGGLSSTEIAVANAPFVHLRAIPGCETYNYKLFTKNGLSLPARSTKKAVIAANQLLEDEQLVADMLNNQSKHIPQNAQDIISERIISGI